MLDLVQRQLVCREMMEIEPLLFENVDLHKINRQVMKRK
jgi:hypothetical protein